MESFSKFFDIARGKATPNTRTHHQNLVRSSTRKHQNQVARRYGYEGKKSNHLIDDIVKNNKKGNWNISKLDAENILKTYGLNHIPNKNYSKAINRTGININYDSVKKIFSLSKA